MSSHPTGRLRRFLSSIDRDLVLKHALILLPLAVTQLLQRLEHVVDTRFVSKLGPSALLTHGVNYNFFLAAQAIGLAAATSALIFWKRVEHLERQRSILSLHILAAGASAGLVAAACLPILPAIIRVYGIETEHTRAALCYLGLGLLNMVLAAIYAPVNALLIASDQRVKSVANVSLIILIKFGAGLVATRLIGPTHLDKALLVIALGGTIAISALTLRAWIDVRRRAGCGRDFEYNEMRSIWRSELGTAAIRSISPFLYTYFLARSTTGAPLMVTYQMTLHLAYIFTLPQLAGTQLAVRDASAEHSSATPHRGLLEAEWFRWFFAVSVLPTLLMLMGGALLAPALIRLIFDYPVPAAHAPFLSIYYLACAVGQIGNVHMVALRAMQRSAVGMRNFFVAEVGVMVLLTGAAVWSRIDSPLILGTIVFAYCATYLALNWLALNDRRWETVR